jgi:PKD repeat protein
VVSFSASELTGPAPLTVRFTDSSTSDISNHLWNFGDNEYEVGSRDPVHTFTKPGRFTVVLAATTSDGGGKTMTMANYITVTQTDPASPTSGVSVAASNSQVKDTATYSCDGSNDQTEIQEAINSVATKGGGDVHLLDGTFNVDGDIHLTSGVNLIGQGAGITTLNFVDEGWIQVDGSNTVKDLQTTGATGFLIVGSHVRMTSVTVSDYTTKDAAFYIYAYNKPLIDIIFTNCNAIDGWSHGFINVGEGSSNSISDISYIGCSAINAGRASQLYPWVNGFTLAESTTINNVLIENCWADGCWESGFYLPEGLDEKDITIKNSISTCNGQKRTIEKAHYGAGFFGGSPTVRFIECISQSNKDGFSLRSGATAIQCKDIGSVYGFSTADNAWITLTDCKSDLAQKWALLGINSHDVTATNFMVTNSKENPYPAVLAGSPKYPSYNMTIQTTAT